MAWPPASGLLAPLVPWFERERRDLPWRPRDLGGPHPDPYAVLVSELMLQQTQVATVIPYFERWMARFPTPRALAQAAEDEVHKAWEGLGYYRRARFLKSAATLLASRGWPADLEGLAALPGLGPYTAAAVGAIAFQWPTPALDGNAFRVLARLLGLEGDPRTRAAELRAWLAPGLAALGPSRLTQGIMELGALRCTPMPVCARCPLEPVCTARRDGRTAQIPPPIPRARPREVALCLLAVEAEGQVLLHPPNGKGLLAGLWRWPTLDPANHPAVPAPIPGVAAWPGWTQVYTHRREAVQPLHVRVDARFPPGKGLQWVALDQLPALPMGKRDQRLRDLLDVPDTPMLEAPDPIALVAALRGDATPAV